MENKKVELSPEKATELICILTAGLLADGKWEYREGKPYRLAGEDNPGIEERAKVVDCARMLLSDIAGYVAQEWEASEPE